MAQHHHTKGKRGAKKPVHHSPAYVQAFITMAVPACQAASLKYGVPVSVMLAQTALESHWGLSAPDNAFFGIKGHAPDGASAEHATHEEIAGQSKGETDIFRAYKDFAEAADDYARTISTQPNFRHALVFRKDPGRFLDAVQRGHYATDSNYKSKVMRLIHEQHLDQYDR